MFQYGGVVAWFCAVKLELYATYVLNYDDIYGVFEWGSGGIVHMHCLSFRSGYGRWDSPAGELVTDSSGRHEQRMLAARHSRDIAEWNLLRADSWSRRGDYDDNLTATLAQPLDTEDEDEADTVSAPVLDADTFALLRRLQGHLDDPGWHPAALAIDIKRLLCSPGMHHPLIRQARRRYLAALLDKTNMHNRHSGPPVTLPPVFGAFDDSASSEDDEENAESNEETGEDDSAVTWGRDQIRLLTWNIDGLGRLEARVPPTFLLETLLRDEASPDVIVLQEVTPEDEDWLQTHCGGKFHIASPSSFGLARDPEGHDQVALISRTRCQLRPRKHYMHVLPTSLMRRRLLVLPLWFRRSGICVTLATAHFDAGPPDRVCGTDGQAWLDVRACMLEDACEQLALEPGEGVIFAGDFNFHAGEPAVFPHSFKDAWIEAGSDPGTAITWARPAHESEASSRSGLAEAVRERRYDRAYFAPRQTPGNAESLQLVAGSFLGAG